MAFGFKPVRYRDGTAYTGAAQRCSYVTAADLYVGDPVKMSGTADANGVAGVVVAGDTGEIYGIVVGLEPRRGDLATNYITSAQATATGGTYVMVATDTNVVYQCEGDEGTNLAITDIGYNTNGSTAGSPSTAFGTSEWALDETDLNTTALQFSIIGLAQFEGNLANVGTTAAVWEVTINLSGAADGGTGIA
jgi:hypothetical protein